MITINFDIAVGLFFTIVLLLVIGSWIRYTMDDERSLKKSADLAQCPYCSFIFIDFSRKEIKVCPRCESYVENKKMPEGKRHDENKNTKK